MQLVGAIERLDSMQWRMQWRLPRAACCEPPPCLSASVAAYRSARPSTDRRLMVCTDQLGEGRYIQGTLLYRVSTEHTPCDVCLFMVQYLSEGTKVVTGWITECVCVVVVILRHGRVGLVHRVQPQHCHERRRTVLCGAVICEGGVKVVFELVHDVHAVVPFDLRLILLYASLGGSSTATAECTVRPRCWHPVVHAHPDCSAPHSASSDTPVRPLRPLWTAAAVGSGGGARRFCRVPLVEAMHPRVGYWPSFVGCRRVGVARLGEKLAKMLCVL
jgi:hypothetical protein